MHSALSNIVKFINQHALENSDTGGASIANSTLDSLLDIGPSSLLTASTRRMLLDRDDDFKHNHSEQHHGRSEGQNLSQPVVSTAGTRGSQPPVEDDTLLPADRFWCNPYKNLLRESECRFDFYATIYSKHVIVLYPNAPIQSKSEKLHLTCFYGLLPHHISTKDVIGVSAGILVSSTPWTYSQVYIWWKHVYAFAFVHYIKTGLCLCIDLLGIKSANTVNCALAANRNLTAGTKHKPQGWSVKVRRQRAVGETKHYNFEIEDRINTSCCTILIITMPSF